MVVKQAKRLSAVFGIGVLLGAAAFGPWEWLVFSVAGLALAVNLFCAFRYDWWTWYVGIAYACGFVIGLALVMCLNGWVTRYGRNPILELGLVLPAVAVIMMPWAVGRFFWFCNRPH